jgi:hypothetical protein
MGNEKKEWKPDNKKMMQLLTDFYVKTTGYKDVRHMFSKEYKVYWPKSNQLKQLSYEVNYYEIWKGLPRLAFEQTALPKNTPLIYENEKAYIWVSPAAALALKEKPETILVAEKALRKGMLFYAPRVDLPSAPFGSTKKSAVTRARELNLEIFLKEENRRKKE